MQKQIHIHLNQGKQHTLSDLTCHICCKEDKVPTPGPGWGKGGSKSIQYFACKEFADLKPFDRF